MKGRPRLIDALQLSFFLTMSIFGLLSLTLPAEWVMMAIPLVTSGEILIVWAASSLSITPITMSLMRRYMKWKG